MAIAFYDSSMIGEIAKSMEYRAEPYRIRSSSLGLIFHGKNHEHYLVKDNESHRCDCDFFLRRGMCSHTMTVEWLVNHSENSSPPWLSPSAGIGT